MTEFSELIRLDKGQEAVPLQIIDTAGFDAWLAAQPEPRRQIIRANKFAGVATSIVIFPEECAAGFAVAIGVPDSEKLGIWCLAKAAESLPAGTYRLGNCDIGDAAIGWMLGQYRFNEYRDEKIPTGPRVLLTSEPGRMASAVLQAEATAKVRDLVNRPAADCGPEALEAELKALAKANNAKITVTSGEPLQSGFPMIHGVGKAATREHAPRLLELTWGDERNPRIALVGKGVTFDSGGLDLKPSASMRLMKKDMGGAAHAIALAQMIMAARLPVRLHLLVAAVENCIGPGAMRPGDILKSRAGITVEIDNTDAEGRLVLGDSLTKAVEDNAELIVDFATLTGAARTALGPDLPAMFANDEALAAELFAAGQTASDPVWRLPLWDGYDEMLASDVADTSNSGGTFAGAITAALFLKKFVTGETKWAHFDTFAWRPTAKPGRPKGGEALGLRAVFRYLAEKYPVR